jgi:hypothetical protein
VKDCVAMDNKLHQSAPIGSAKTRIFMDRSRVIKSETDQHEVIRLFYKSEDEHNSSKRLDILETLKEIKNQQIPIHVEFHAESAWALPFFQDCASKISIKTTEVSLPFDGNQKYCFKKLEELYLDNVNVYDWNKFYSVDFPQLKKISLTRSSIATSRVNLLFLRNAYLLETLVMDSCFLSQNIFGNESYSVFDGLNNLKNLSLKSSFIADEIFSNLNLASLERLDLTNSVIARLELEAPELESLNLDGVPNNYTLLDDLKKFKKLKHLLWRNKKTTKSEKNDITKNLKIELPNTKIFLDLE